MATLISEGLDIDIWWDALTKNDPRWGYCNSLYAYVSQDGSTLLHIGMAGRETLKERFDCESKDGFVDWAISEGFPNIRVLIGQIETDTPRFTIEMLQDVESLLIFRLKPLGNVRNTLSRNITRPGLRVRCLGDVWPTRRNFRDRE
jgi:hypothetical protein